MKERSRLTRILRLKERIKDASSGRLAAAEAEVVRAREAVAAKDAQLVALAGGVTRAGEMSARELSSLANMHARARVERTSLVELQQVANRTRDARAAELTRAGRELRKFEVLDERLAREERDAERRAEQQALDESARRLGGAA